MKNIFYLFILIVLVSCNDLRYKRSKLVLTETAIKQDTIKERFMSRGSVVYNGYYSITTISYLVNDKKTIPNWLKNKNWVKKRYENNELIYINDIDLPFVLFKESGDEYFYVIKNNDTLKFKLVAYK